uniref:Uncharacterized protein n=1 Tax=Ditylum brightwellii TaxID=49249 RepID=A0A6S9DN39_9STRA|mmetsp:Transcript_34926/g.46909  ORF Transcript_34926/g.46909 Transcript_34926/m.46909 type:complete len:174 (-) Transcript_34926:1952-2473(-)
MSSTQSQQKQSAERIRERFLHKIGIEPPQPNMENPAVPLLQSAVINQPSLPQTPTSCLGDVTPFYETLKVCLDDDTSMEDEDDDYFDDEDFFIGEDYAFEPMAMEKVPTMPLNTSSPETLTQQFASKPQNSPSPVPQAALVSDEGSSQSESSSLSTDFSSVDSSTRYSCGEYF